MSATLEERYAPAIEESCRATLDERVREEVETLKSILMDDVIIKKVEDRPEIIETVIRPSTGCDVDQQYVCVTLEVTLPDRYPDLSPIVMLRNPRGLDDRLLETLHKKIKQMLHQHIGSVVIYSIVELLRGYLTNSNLPSGRCTICLFGFITGDAFIKTQCYHYFHKHCLANHLHASKQSYTEELEKLPNWKRMEAAPFLQTCPVCRSTVYYDVDTLKEAPPPIESENAAPFELTPEMRALQKKMAALLKKQVAKGGVVGDGDNGPPPLTITTAADFPGSSGAPGCRGNNVNIGHHQMNPSPDGLNGASGSGRGSVSRRGVASHPGPQNIASSNTARGKVNGTTNVNPPRGVANVNPPHGVGYVNPPRGVNNVNPPHGGGYVNPPRGVNNVNTPHGGGYVNPPRGVNNVNQPHGVAYVNTQRGVANVNPPHGVANVNPPHGVAYMNPSRGVANVNPPHGVAYVNPPRGVNNVNPPHGVAYPPRGVANVNPPHVPLSAPRSVTPIGISPSTALYNAARASFGFNPNRAAIATANADRGVISTAPAPAPVPETPGSPSGRPAYRGPYRGFNRRAKPGRRGQNSR